MDSMLRDAWIADGRAGLHVPGAWVNSDEVSLTYCATNAGFAGRAELEMAARAWPEHPLAGADGAEVRSVSVSVCGDRLVEEVVVGMRHMRQMDWLAPGVAATGKDLVLPMAIVAQFDAAGVARVPQSVRGPFAGTAETPRAVFPQLRNVRVYWDGATVLSQLGVVAMAFAPLAAVRGSAAVEQCVSHLPIAEGSRVAHRLLRGASPSNGNHLCPLAKASSSSTLTSAVRLGPIGGLDNVGALVRELPRLAETIEPASAMVRTSVFDEQRPPVEHRVSSYPALESHGLSSVLAAIDKGEIAHHVPAPIARTSPLQPADGQSIPQRVVHVDPLRFSESVKTIDDAHVARTIDPSRFTESTVTRDDTHHVRAIDPSRFSETGVTTLESFAAGGAPRRVNASHLQSSVGQPDLAHGSFSTGGLPRKINASHLQSSIAPASQPNDPIPQGSFSTGGIPRKVNTSHLRSTLPFGQ